MIEPPWEFGPAAAISRSLWNWSMTLISSETASGFPQIWEKKSQTQPLRIHKLITHIFILFVCVCLFVCLLNPFLYAQDRQIPNLEGTGYF